MEGLQKTALVHDPSILYKQKLMWQYPLLWLKQHRNNSFIPAIHRNKISRPNPDLTSSALILSNFVPIPHLQIEFPCNSPAPSPCFPQPIALQQLAEEINNSIKPGPKPGLNEILSEIKDVRENL